MEDLKSFKKLANFLVDVDHPLPNSSRLYRLLPAVKEEEADKKLDLNASRGYVAMVFGVPVAEKYTSELLQLVQNWQSALGGEPKLIELEKVVETPNNVYLLMRRAQKSLGTMLANREMRWETLHVILSQVVYGLQSLSGHQLVHRKLSLDSILVDYGDKGEPRCYIAGIKYLKRIEDKYVEKVGWVDLPTEIKNEKKLSEATNILSLGLLIKEIDEKYANGKMVKRSHDKFVNLKEMCLEPDPSKRAKYGDVLNHPYMDTQKQKDFDNFYDKGKGVMMHKEIENNVFLGTNKITREEFIIKTLDSKSSRSIDEELNFLMSQNVGWDRLLYVKEYFYDVNHSCYYVVEDKPKGILLREYVENAGERKMSPDEFRNLVRCIAKAVAEIHSINIAHRDITPDWIYLKLEEGTNTVISASITGISSFRELAYTQYYRYEGNVDKGFRAPEIIFKTMRSAQRPSNDNGKKADIYSFGKVVRYVHNKMMKGGSVSGAADADQEKNLEDDVNKLCSDCIKGKANERPNIIEVISYKLIEAGKQEHERYQATDCVLGNGSFGSVCKCIDRATGTMLAMKKCKKLDEQTVKIINDEVAAYRDCQKSEHIVRYVTNYVFNKEIYLIMELFDMDLYDYLVKKKLSSRECKLIATSTAKAMEFLHNQKKCHRDLKPANVFVRLDKDGLICEAKVGDLGFVKKEIDRLETFKGTGDYMAPEISTERGKPYTILVDVWSYGVMLTVMATNNVDCFGNTNQKGYLELAHKLVCDNPRLLEVIECSLQVDPARRKPFSELLSLGYFK